jgi:hypothetical protein
MKYLGEVIFIYFNYPNIWIMFGVMVGLGVNCLPIILGFCISFFILGINCFEKCVLIYFWWKVGTSLDFVAIKICH